MIIACATNFSDESIHAASVAAALARRCKEQLLLIHVVSTKLLRTFAAPLVRAEQALAAEAERLTRLGTRVETVLASGRPELEISRIVGERSARLLLLGDTAGAMGAFGGGHLDRLVSVSAVPAMVVRDPKPFETWLTTHRPLRLLLALDRTVSSAVARDWVRELAELGPLEVIGAHLYWPAEEWIRLGIDPPESYEAVPPKVVNTLQHELHHLLGKWPTGSTHRVVTRICADGVAQGLLELATQEQVDLVVTGTHHRTALGRLGSVSHECLRSAMMSVACVPATAQHLELQPLPRLRRVLVATDFTEVGNRAIGYAFAALAPGGTVDLVHVAGEQPVSPDVAQDLLSRLFEVVPEEARWRGATIRPQLLFGSDPALAIAQAAERLHSDLICIGSNGPVGLQESVSAQVSHHTRRPMLTVRAPME